MGLCRMNAFATGGFCRRVEEEEEEEEVEVEEGGGRILGSC